MRRRILVIGAGTGASNNLIRSLKAGDPSFFIVGAHTDRFVLKKSSADRKYFMPAPDAPAFIRSVRRIVAAERIDLIIPTGDADVEALSEHRHRFPGRIFLPSRAIVDLCQDKYELTMFLRAHGVPAPDTYPVVDLERIEDLFGSLEGRGAVWGASRIRDRWLQRRSQGSARRGAVRPGDHCRALLHRHDRLRPRGQAQHAAHVREAGPRRRGGLPGRVRRGRGLLSRARSGYLARGVPRGGAVRWHQGGPGMSIRHRGSRATISVVMVSAPLLLVQPVPSVGQLDTNPRNNCEASVHADARPTATLA